MIEDFNKILHHPEVTEEIRFLMGYGKKQPLYTNYFGVNFNANGLVSVKLYFSYLRIPDDEVLERYSIDRAFIDDMKKHWKSEPEKKYIHQGVTLGLKCSLKENQIRVNSYVHYRSPDYHLGFPKDIRLTESDKLNYAGFCLENHSWGSEVKKYYYISDPVTQHKILTDFNMEGKMLVSDLSLIEYTESDVEKKINLITRNSASVKNVLDSLQNPGINAFSQFLYEKHGLYYFAPGFRYGKDTVAIYYLPKSLYYDLDIIHTIDGLL